jgi:hypothetical protein
VVQPPHGAEETHKAQVSDEVVPEGLVTEDAAAGAPHDELTAAPHDGIPSRREGG